MAMDATASPGMAPGMAGGGAAMPIPAFLKKGKKKKMGRMAKGGKKK